MSLRIGRFVLCGVVGLALVIGLSALAASYKETDRQIGAAETARPSADLDAVIAQIDSLLSAEDFGGYYVEDGVLTVLLTDPADSALLEGREGIRLRYCEHTLASLQSLAHTEVWQLAEALDIQLAAVGVPENVVYVSVGPAVTREQDTAAFSESALRGRPLVLCYPGDEHYGGASEFC